ncbi:hypothetical protein C9J44_20860 [Photobacterium sp. GB-27]|uniref:type I-Fv CRISPR-associated protein Cas7fv n=1 Tax=Photobacterium sp. GB-27 TaxID=2022109 RepID=UPI000D151E02|nr:type I-Fv CRISPR-associated protein Cas7fv [Photobacterium sp. GB-27]PSV30341.1 hypothetical protein C9J44_20860 [Photobacterium sp. GB-27]
MNINYIEFSLQASGFGCVNTNGNINPYTGKQGGDDGFKNRIFAKQRNGKMYISSNCIRGYFFEPDAKGMMLSNQGGYNNNKGDNGELVISSKDMPMISQKIASSYLGLIRGYMLTEKGGDAIKRNSPLMVTDWVNENGEPNKNEVMVNHLALDEDGKKESNSLFYQDTWGDTLYHGMAVLSLEQMQFIEMDNRLGHQAVRFNQNPKKAKVNDDIETFKTQLIYTLKAIGSRCGMAEETYDEINVTYGRFLKKDMLFAYPEEGILLNNAALHALVLETKRRFDTFSIIKSKGFVRTDKATVSMRSTFTAEGFAQALSPDVIPDYACFYDAIEDNNEA